MNTPCKTIIVINGKGGVGKDTLCDCLLTKYKVMNISAIEPIKEIASKYGWNGEKDNKSRKFLADLKQAFIAYNNLPTTYLEQKTAEFLTLDKEILFVHIREADQIEQYKKSIYPHKCFTLLVTRDIVDNTANYGNHADDDVNQYEYDYIFDNNLPIEKSKESFIELIKQIRNY